MKTVSSFRQLHLYGRSVQANKVSDLLDGRFDLALVAPSWDRRCTCVTEATTARFRKTIFLKFTTEDEHGYQARHSKQILTFLATIGSGLVTIEGDAVDLE